MPEPLVPLADRPDAVVVPHPTKDLLAEAAAARLLLVVAEEQARGETVHLSLTGGSMGSAVWEKVAESPLLALVDLPAVHFWWSDERFLGAGDGELNAVQAFEAFFAAADLPAEHLHTVATSDVFRTQDDAADAYREELARWAPEGEEFPVFAVSMLGMGPDGHMASLFPGRDEVLLDSADVVGIDGSPKPPPQRVTMTRPLINRSERVWFLVAGADKAEAAARLVRTRDCLPSAEELRQTPASGARGSLETLYLVTDDALTA